MNPDMTVYTYNDVDMIDACVDFLFLVQCLNQQCCRSQDQGPVVRKLINLIQD